MAEMRKRGRLSAAGHVAEEWLRTALDAALLASGQLTIDLGALATNFLMVKGWVAPAEAAAVVKADAYGLGHRPVVQTLLAKGCRHFFAADLAEALLVRQVAPDAAVYALNGLWPGAEAQAEAGRITPVLNSLDQIERWRVRSREQGRRLAAIIQIDSGMSRLGLSTDEVGWLARHGEIFEDLDVRYFMSHLACAETPDASETVAQREAFAAAVRLLPSTPTTLANSAATLGAPATHGDLVRCGLALYGGAPIPDIPNPLRPVVQASARVVQLRTVSAGTGVGYGLDFRAPKTMRIATVSAGYADGWPRRLGDRGAVYFGDLRLRIVGRVSMDTMTVDASEADALRPGDWVELIGPHQSLEDVAGQADTIAYEILTNLSRRFVRRYLPIGPSA